MSNHPQNRSSKLPAISEETLLWTEKKNTFFGKPWSFTRYSLFNDRLLIKRGFFTRHREELRLYRIKDVILRQSLLQLIFGVGTLTIWSTDVSTARFLIINIKNPEYVANLISDSAEAERIAKGVTVMDCFDTLR